MLCWFQGTYNAASKTQCYKYTISSMALVLAVS